MRRVFLLFLLGVFVSGDIVQDIADDMTTASDEDGRLFDANSIYCPACISFMDTVIVMKRVLNLPDRFFSTIIEILCRTVLSPIIGTEVCLGLLKIHLPTMMFIIKNSKLLGSSACAILFQNYNCRGELPPKWYVKVKDGETVPRNKLKPNATPLKILQVTDIHYDPMYTASATANCGLPLCCQKDNPAAANSSNRAGYWTDYRNCDVPGRLITSTFGHINKTHALDYVYFTGDIVSHRMWDTSFERNTEDIKFVMDEFRSAFGRVPIFPILGNHEPHPLNLYAPESQKNTNLSTQWLFNLAAEIWKDVLPAGTDLKTIRRGGYYTVKLKNGLRIVALNSNVGYTLNFWLWYDDVDPYGQLQWLADTLQEAEKAGESVHILTHLPSGDEYTYVRWAEEYNKIVERYANTITGMFYGHTHLDEFNVYYKNGVGINVGYNGGSLTPFSNVNPNYRIYHVDPVSFLPIDFDQYYINLTSSNEKWEPEWKKQYSFKEQYGLKTMEPKEVGELVNRISENATLRDIYFRNKVRNADPSLAEGCDKQCQKNNVCNLATTVYSDNDVCNSMVKLMK